MNHSKQMPKYYMLGGMLFTIGAIPAGDYYNANSVVECAAAMAPCRGRVLAHSNVIRTMGYVWVIGPNGKYGPIAAAGF